MTAESIIQDASESTVGTTTERSVRFIINGESIEVGRFYASIGRNLKGFNIQLFINDDCKALVNDNQELVATQYTKFYADIVNEAKLAGWNFIS